MDKNTTSGLGVANKGGFDTGRDREIPPDIEFPILPGEDAKYVSYQVDEAKQRRASAVHQGVLVHVRRWLSAYTDTVKENTAADTICLIGDTAHIFEFKGITEGTELDQYRNAVAKLYEYRYRMASNDHRYTDAYLWIVLSGPLHRQWIVDYLIEDRHIGVLWIEGEAVGGPSLAAFERIARAVTTPPSKP